MKLHNNKPLKTETIEELLKELGKEIRKEYGRNADVELIIVGGASILLNYGVRESTTDIDAAIRTRSSINSLIYKIAERHNIPDKWLNDDFKRTSSYSDKIDFYSKPYKTYGGVLHVRTISDEFLLAMKMNSFRGYKNDISDIARIIKCIPAEIKLEDVKQAYVKLYGDLSGVSKTALDFVSKCFNEPNSLDINKIIHKEEINKKTLLDNNNEETLNKINKDLEKDFVKDDLHYSEEEFMQLLEKSKSQKTAQNISSEKKNDEIEIDEV